MTLGTSPLPHTRRHGLFDSADISDFRCVRRTALMLVNLPQRGRACNRAGRESDTGGAFRFPRDFAVTTITVPDYSKYRFGIRILVPTVPISRKLLQELSRVRIRDARVLLRAGQWQGCFYITGYAVECAIKACIAKKTRKYDFPPGKRFVDGCYSHNLKVLLGHAGLTEKLPDGPLLENWQVCLTWDSEKRYDPSIGASEARELYAACTARTHGVLRWLKSHW